VTGYCQNNSAEAWAEALTEALDGPRQYRDRPSKGKEGKKRQDKQVAIVKQLIGID